MTLTIHPGTVEGTVAAPPSKSVTHRAIAMTFLTNGGTVADPLWSQDTLATLHGLKALGLGCVATRNELVVRGGASRPAEIDARNSGTTLRLLTALAATVDGTSRLTGDDSLTKRPMGPLVDALGQLGAEATCQGPDGRPPIEVTGPTPGGKAAMPADTSSQFVSALLMAGPRLPDGLELELTTSATSRPYIDLTLAMMRRVGFEIQEEGNRFRVDPQTVPPARIEVPGDYSGAAFPLVAAAITDGPVTVTNLPEASGQGDEAILEILRAFGAKVSRDGGAVTVHQGDLHAAEVDLANTPDLFPALCVLATAAEGRTILHDAPHLAHKESDRIQAMTEGLSALGAKITARDDGAEIEGTPLTGGTVEHHHDHRIQMALAIAALRAEDPVTIQGPTDVHAVSYPSFLNHLRALGAEVETRADTGGDHA